MPSNERDTGDDHGRVLTDSRRDYRTLPDAAVTIRTAHTPVAAIAHRADSRRN